MCDADDLDACDVISCVAMVLMTLGVTVVGMAYLLPYDELSSAGDSVRSGGGGEVSARQTESDELRAWTVFTILWTTGLSLIAVSVVIITSALVYTNCQCQRTSSLRDDTTRLSRLDTSTGYGSSDKHVATPHYH